MIDAGEAAIGSALVAMVAGTRPVLTVEQVASHLLEFYQLRVDNIKISRFPPDDFLSSSGIVLTRIGFSTARLRRAHLSNSRTCAGVVKLRQRKLHCCSRCSWTSGVYLRISGILTLPSALLSLRH